VAVAAIGYGGGFPEPIATFGYVSHPLFSFPDFVNDPASPPGTIVFGNFVPGMSGGPIIDKQNRVLSVVQQGGHAAGPAQNLGYGIAWELLMTFTEKYWE
jgi:hypothetical protein